MPLLDAKPVCKPFACPWAFFIDNFMHDSIAHGHMFPALDGACDSAILEIS